MQKNHHTFTFVFVTFLCMITSGKNVLAQDIGGADFSARPILENTRQMIRQATGGLMSNLRRN